MISHIIKLIWNKKSANALLILEILLAFIVLFAVLSFVFYNTDRLDNPLGFETENIKYVRFGDLEELDSLQRIETIERMRTELEDLELIQEVAFSTTVSPFGQSNWCHGNDDNGYHIEACYGVVDYNFIQTNGMNIIEGRGFLEDDLNATYPPIIPNKQFMENFYPGQSMIDSIIMYAGLDRQIIGVVEAYKYGGEFEESENRMLLLYNPAESDQFRITNAYLKLDPSADVAFEEKISNTVKNVLSSSSFVIQDAPALRKRTNLETWIPMVALLSMCGFLCLNVALGLFGVLSYSISKRRSEVGLRRAVGASGGSIAQQFTLEVILLAAVALIIGIFFAVQIVFFDLVDANSSIFYRGIVYGAGVILLVVTICALYPSLQASRIHPATALHED